jgi:DNA topoisomerase IA
MEACLKLLEKTAETWSHLLQVRAHVENQILMIAQGKEDKEAVVQHALQQFLQKFLFFVQHIERMDSLFEASFSPLTASGASDIHPAD